MKKDFRLDFHYFRAFAIILIVAGHCINTYGSGVLVNGYIKTLFTGGTALFVFISGFLFSYLYNERFNFNLYLEKKLKFIFLPYFVLTTVTFVYYYLIRGFEPMFYSDNLLISYLYMLFLGKSFTCYWYIPMALLLFLSAPLVIKFRGLKFGRQIFIIIPLFSVALLVHRPVGLTNTFQSYIYYIPFYLLGISYHIYGNILEKFVDNFWILNLIMFFVVLVIQVDVFHHVGNYHKNLFTYKGFDLMLISRLFLIFFLLHLSRRVSKLELKLLYIIADTSFAIFFLHMIFRQQFQRYFIPYTGDFMSDIVGIILRLFVYLFISVVCALCLKQVFGKKSRYLIGY